MPLPGPSRSTPLLCLALDRKKPERSRSRDALLGAWMRPTPIDIAELAEQTRDTGKEGYSLLPGKARRLHAKGPAGQTRRCTTQSHRR
jgi:hypothetical protein